MVAEVKIVYVMIHEPYNTEEKCCTGVFESSEAAEASLPSWYRGKKGLDYEIYSYPYNKFCFGA